MPITNEEIAKARVEWGDGLIRISQAFAADGIAEAKRTANAVLDAAYGYNFGPVLFKPTMSGGALTFRTTKRGALSYFVGDDPDYPLDGGFGIKGWCSVTSETAATFIENDLAMWMGWFTMIDKDGKSTKVDKSFGYKKDEDGALRIVLHHSSIPYET